MTLKWIVGGAAAGALAALLVWFVGADEGVARSTKIDAPVDQVSGAIAEPLAEVAPSLVRAEAASVDPAPIENDAFGAFVVGNVVDPQGQPVPLVTLEIEGPQARHAYLQTSTSGGWTWFQCEPGTWRVEVRADGFLTANESIEIAGAARHLHTTVLERAPHIPTRFEDPAGVAFDFAREPLGFEARIGVAVTREHPGRALPARGTRRESYGAAATWVARDGWTDITGTSLLPSDMSERFNGLLVLKERAPLWVAATYGSAVLEARPLSGDESELVFVVDPANLAAHSGTVRVRVLSGITGALVESGVALAQPQGGSGNVAGVVDGVFVFRDVTPGRVDLVCEAEGLEKLERGVVVEPGAEVDLGTIVLGARASFELQLVDENGAPLQLQPRTTRPGLSSGVHDLDERYSVSRTSSTGFAKIPFHALGPTLIRVGGSEGRALVGVLADTSVTNPVVLRVPLGIEVGFDFTTEPPPGTTIVVENADGVPLHIGRLDTLLLASGAHSVVLFDGTRELARQSFTVGATRGAVVVEVPR